MPKWTPQMMEDIHLLLTSCNLLILALVVWLHARVPPKKP